MTGTERCWALSPRPSAEPRGWARCCPGQGNGCGGGAGADRGDLPGGALGCCPRLLRQAESPGLGVEPRRAPAAPPGARPRAAARPSATPPGPVPARPGAAGAPGWLRGAPARPLPGTGGCGAAAAVAAGPVPKRLSRGPVGWSPELRGPPYKSAPPAAPGAHGAAAPWSRRAPPGHRARRGGPGRTPRLSTTTSPPRRNPNR